MEVATLCKFKENQVSFIIDGGVLDGSKGRVSIEVRKKLPILQKPNEDIMVKFTLKCLSHHFTCDDLENTSTNHSFQSDLTLTFNNYLHECSHDYGYEIDCHAYLYKIEPAGYHHVLLFSHKQIRKTNQMSFLKQQFKLTDLALCLHKVNNNHKFYDGNLVHICCTIVRYNRKKRINLTSLSNSNSVGSMLLKSGHYSDISLAVEDQVFRVHKHILSSKSKVFDAMFTHNMIENQNGIVIINDFNVKVIEGLLSYIYTDDVEMTEISIELFQAAHKYEINDLQAQCEEYFLFNVNCQNVIRILDVASLYGLQNLKTSLMAFVKNHEWQMISEQSFREYLVRDLNLDTIVYTLKLCDKYALSLLNIEAKIFEFVKAHNTSLVKKAEFLELFKTHPQLMERLYVYIHS